MSSAAALPVRGEVGRGQTVQCTPLARGVWVWRKPLEWGQGREQTRERKGRRSLSSSSSSATSAKSCPLLWRMRIVDGGSSQFLAAVSVWNANGMRNSMCPKSTGIRSRWNENGNVWMLGCLDFQNQLITGLALLYWGEWAKSRTHWNSYIRYPIFRRSIWLSLRARITNRQTRC